MNILLLGSGGREHALARALRDSASCTSLYAAPANPGILEYASLAPIDVTRHENVVRFCRENGIDLVVIGPDQMLADGMANDLRTASIHVFGPSKAASKIEWSKSFAKEMMLKAHIPTAHFQRFTKEERAAAESYVTRHSLPVVIKADGLALGKGVVVAETHEEALAAVREMFDGSFAVAGNTIVVEEFLRGEEASVFALCDAQNFVCLASAQDHKRALDGDLGKNTGGMGSYAPAPIVNSTVMKTIEDTIIAPLLQTMKTDGIPFVGCLFVGLMIENDVPMVVEFNARFGDPETQSILSILDADFAQVCYSCAVGKLDTSSIKSTANGSACTVVLASGGYPDDYDRGFEIHGLKEAAQVARVFHAGTKSTGDLIVTNGGRVLGVTGIAPTLEQAIGRAYDAVELIDFEKKFFRRDIGKKGLQTLRNNEQRLEKENEV